MHILFDQGTPAPLILFLKDHVVTTASEAGWDKISDGELLRAAEQAGFDVLLTTDKRFVSQQNLRNRRIAIVVLGNQRWAIARRYVRRIVATVDAALPGSYKEVEMPFR